MPESPRHATHPRIVKRLRRADGHLQKVVRMIEDGRPCLELAQQLHAVERAVAQAKRVLIQDHIDHCLDRAAAEPAEAGGPPLQEFKAIAKYL